MNGSPLVPPQHWPPGTFGGQGMPFPGAPTCGPWIGRADTIKRGERRSLISTDAVGYAGQIVTVCLTRLDAPPSIDSTTPDNVDTPLVAHVNFGAGGCREVCRVDWLNGTLLTIPAGGLEISCEYPDTSVVDEFTAADFDQSVGVIVAAGARPPSSGIVPQARLTDRLGLVIAGGSGISVVPPRAQSLMLFTDKADDYGSYEVAFRTTANPAIVGPAFTRTLARMKPTSPGEVPLLSSVRSVQVTNFAAAANLAVVYAIAL